MHKEGWQHDNVNKYTQTLVKSDGTLEQQFIPLTVISKCSDDEQHVAAALKCESDQVVVSKLSEQQLELLNLY